MRELKHSVIVLLIGATRQLHVLEVEAAMGAARVAVERTISKLNRSIPKEAQVTVTVHDTCRTLWPE